MGDETDSTFQLGEWLVEPALNRVSRQDVAVHLEPKTMAVLVYLRQRPDEVVSAEQIIADVWSGRPMGDNPVYKSIAKLRRALDDDPARPSYIATVPKKGYRLIDPVSHSPGNRRTGDAADPASSVIRRIAPIIAGLAIGAGIAAALFWEPRSAPTSIRPVSTFAGSHSQPSFAPDGESIAFVNDTDGTPHIWVLGTDETPPRQVTTGSAPDARPRWSPDGQTLLFVRSGNVLGVPVDGGPAKEILRDASNPNWSRDGSFIVFERRYEVWVADADGGNQQRISTIPRLELALTPRWPAVSPDGRQIVYFGSGDTPEGDLWIADIAGGAPEQITFAPALGGAPVWTPDGKQIIYSTQRAGGRTLWAVDVAERTSAPLLTGSGDDDFPDVTTDGTMIAYSNSRERFALLQSGGASGDERVLHESRLPIVAPELSPDGETIAFFGGARTGGFQLFTLPASGGNPMMLTSDAKFAHAIPRWSANGESLFFYVTGNGTSYYGKIAATGGTPEQVVPDWTWNTANGANIDPTGRRIVYSRLAGQAPIQTSFRDLDTGEDASFHATLEYPRWSRDGESVAGSLFTNQRFPGDIAICPVRDDKCRTLAQDARIPMWSVDQSRIFFVRGFGESQALFVINADGSGPETKIMDMAPLFPLGPFYSVTADDAILWIRHEKERGAIWIATNTVK